MSPFTLQVTRHVLEKELVCAQPMVKERSQDVPGLQEGCKPWTLHHGAWPISNTETLKIFLKKHLVIQEN